MSLLTTSFAGLKLSNPIIVSSSGLTDSAEKIARLAEAGAGAVVMKSLFEEQIMMETNQAIAYNAYEHSEGYDYFSTYIRQHKVSEYLDVIRNSKKSCDIPVIASISCHDDAEWTSFAKEIENAGADALEINILALQTSKKYEYGSFEKEHVSILQRLKKDVNIPIIMKLGNNFSNPINLIDQLKENGADAVVLFNRFYPVDIDTDTMTHTVGQVLSNGSELSNSLRWTGIASNVVKNIDIAISGGVHDGDGIVKSILAGANAVEVCSIIFEKGPEFIKVMNDKVIDWINKKGFSSISQFIGKLNAGSVNDETNMFERTQFMKYFGGKH